MKSRSGELCPLCGGVKKEGMTTFTADLTDTVVVVRQVPITLCSLYGNEWISDEVAAQLEKIVNDAKRKKHQVEITMFQKVA